MLWFKKKEKIKEIKAPKELKVLNKEELEAYLKIIDFLMDESLSSLAKKGIEEKAYAICHNGEVEEYDAYHYSTLSFYEYSGTAYFSSHEDALGAWNKLSREQKNLYMNYWGES